MREITVPSWAKINWSLRILGRRADGFHDLETIFQTISLSDELTFRDADRLSLVCDDPAIPVDDANLVIRTARALGAPPVAIELRKRVPAGGGLGGGSSNAAVTLRVLDEMFAMRRTDLHEIALSLGSDVPFFLMGGTAYATGRGEELMPMESRAGIPLLLLIPDERVLTREAFARVDHYSAPIGMNAHRGLENYRNDFEEPAFAVLPRLRLLKDRLIEAGAIWAAMSGSGSTIFGVFDDAVARDAAVGRFADVRIECCETI